MDDTLTLMDKVMPLEVWGMAIGVIAAMILWIAFMFFIEWYSND